MLLPNEHTNNYKGKLMSREIYIEKYSMELVESLGFKKPHIRGEHYRFYSHSGKLVCIQEKIIREDLLPFITNRGEVITKQNIYIKMGRVS